MSTNAYVDEVKIRQDAGFKETPYDNKGNGGIKFHDINLFTSGGRLHAMLGDDEILPALLAEFVTDVSFYSHIQDSARTRREQGIYKHESAEAEVEAQTVSKGRDGYFIKVKGKRLEDCRELVRQIKTGVIRPTESYEGSQQGMSREDLERELRRITELAARQARELESLRSDLEQSRQVQVEMQQRHQMMGDDYTFAQERVRAAYQFAADLTNKRWQWPLCFKAKVGTRLTQALNGAGK